MVVGEVVTEVVLVPEVVKLVDILVEYDVVTEVVVVIDVVGVVKSLHCENPMRQVFPDVNGKQKPVSSSLHLTGAPDECTSESPVHP